MPPKTNPKVGSAEHKKLVNKYLETKERLKKQILEDKFKESDANAERMKWVNAFK